MSEEPKDEGQRQPLDIYDAILALIDQMASISWQKLGLQPDIMTGRIHPDLPQARVAIDLTAYMAGLLEGRLDDEDKRRLQGLVRDLRINWVERNKEVGG